jgi:hypothetical protein
LLSPTSESKNSFSDTLGYVNTIQKLTGKLEKSRCLSVPLVAMLAVEKMPNNSTLLIKLKSIGRKLVLTATFPNSFMTEESDNEVECIHQGD